MRKYILFFMLSAIAKITLAQVPNIYITEYFDGSSSQNAIEIINASGAAVDLSKIRIRSYYNGSTTSATASTTSIADDGTTSQIPAGGLFVYYFTGTNGFLTSEVATNLPNATASKRAGLSTGGALGFGGDDAVELEYNTTGTTWERVDLIGCIGEDPGTSWSKTVNGVFISTASRSLYRKLSVTTGVKVNPAIGTFDISLEWGLNYGAAPVAPYTSLGVLGETLPVELDKFEAKAGTDGNYLSWVTLSEQNNSYFEISSAKDGKSFNPIAKINGAINSSSLKRYDFTDKNASPGVTYYILKQVDLDGVSKIYGPIYVNNALNGAVSDIKIIPSQEQVKLHISALQKEEVSVKIFSIQGQNIFTKRVLLNNGYNETVLPLSLNKGIYLLTLEGSHTRYGGKFLMN
ncbi:lamin tail domain-containing protein [Pedobacter puniceum]|uniref:T9SS type A sorting domain-containing protein n=1 Tax=Pedobacter puniceum TaxID=2666136 RepID=A0A7K0FK13_9SPHI|nr:T9SS type A sorting domain-containing protein [Pedobacter puniceum]MRX45765.1 T9SS type A sorting domain-containing protein [Pedobacter puniceum]